MRGVHADACKYFGTVLGPEANEAHRDHFHLDMKPRRHSNFCE
ncbi:extensin family protein [Methyloceanibacter superfactus]|nr:extensin family protein [Methyloceanibacter superfactus]